MLGDLISKETQIFLERIKNGERQALGRAITIVENKGPKAQQIIKGILRQTGSAMVIGITGPGGAGKSSIIDKLAVALKDSNRKVAVLAVDPTSSLTNGAFLGDRVRMSSIADANIYIRSIASRGATGAISSSMRDIIRVVEYAGYDTIIAESVGAGQTEVDISKISDITVVVFSPNTGDRIQTVKAGVNEIGDIYVVNKSDLAGARPLFEAIRDNIGNSKSNPEVLLISTKTGAGIKALYEKLELLMPLKHKEKAEKEGGKIEEEVEELVMQILRDKLIRHPPSKTVLDYMAKAKGKEISPLEAAQGILDSLEKGEKK